MQSRNAEVLPSPPNSGKAAGSHSNVTGQQDLRLAQRLISGCNQAWLEFVTRYAGLVQSRVSKIAVNCGLGSDRALIDDLVAEVFSALLNNDSAALRAFEGRSSLATYLCVIASRVAIRKSVQAAQSANASTGTMATTGMEPADLRCDTPPQAAIDAEQKEQLHQLIQELPDKQRTIVQMFYLESMSYDQISTRLNIPIGSVGPTLKRAEAKLRSRLDVS
jgi:RNA polymerase sigma-70 factor (ECF subfamily)